MLETMNDQARELRRKYMREWRSRNKARIREYNKNYWTRKAEAEQKAGGKNGEEKNKP